MATFAIQTIGDKIAETVAQHCMEGMGEETLSFPVLKTGKRQKVHLGRSVSTDFVADCSYKVLSTDSYHSPGAFEPETLENCTGDPKLYQLIEKLDVFLLYQLIKQ